MPETVAGIGSYFGAGAATVGEGAAVGEAGAAAAADAAVVDAGATAGVAGGTAASGGGALAAQGAYAAGTEATFGTGVADTSVSAFAAGLGKTVATTALTAGVQSALAPKRPDLPVPLPMPDPVATEAARRKSLIDQISRRGRASTILSDNAAGTLGG
jgi:hypothetical protein